MKVLNFGSLNYDYVYQVDHIVKPKETCSSLQMQTFCGGKGMNQSIALAKAGVLVFHVGMVGVEGDALIQECEKNGVDTTFIQKVDGKSGHTIIQVDKAAQNCILLYGGSNQKITSAFIDHVLSHFSQGDFLLLQNEINRLDEIIEKADKKGLQIVLNPSPYDEKLEACDLSKISIFILNEVEGEAITGEHEPEKIIKQLLARFPKAKIVLTLGEDGVLYADSTMHRKQDIFKVKAVDTTAAGDTFTGYFIAGLLNGDTIDTTLRMASMASAIAVTREGAAPSIPTREEVIAELQKVE